MAGLRLVRNADGLPVILLQNCARNVSTDYAKRILYHQKLGSDEPIADPTVAVRDRIPSDHQGFQILAIECWS